MTDFLVGLCVLIVWAALTVVIVRAGFAAVMRHG